MAPPSALPRLSQLNPAAVATEISEIVARHASRLALKLGPAYHLAGAGDLKSSDLWLTAGALVAYAQTGTDAEAENGEVAAEYARDRVQELCGLLWTSAGDALKSKRAGAGEDAFEALFGPTERGEPTTAVGIALLAAWARVGLAEGRELSSREIAALGSCSIRAVQQALDDKELTLSAKSARRWLSGRGVPGL